MLVRWSNFESILSLVIERLILADFHENFHPLDGIVIRRSFQARCAWLKTREFLV